jgi:RNA polymerase primary sigma factor
MRSAAAMLEEPDRNEASDSDDMPAPVEWADDRADAAAEAPAGRDLTAAFYQDVAQVGLLTREEEEALGAAIVRQRRRVRGVLRGRRRLVAAALRDAGRGVVHPDRDFREREALTVLTYARRQLALMPRTQRGRKVLREFVAALERELAAYRALRDRMMTANVRLVMTLARRYRHPTLSYLDLVQEGALGLMRAVEKYEPSRGIKFSTYAVWWIWQQISRAADCQGAMIRTPVHWNQFRRKLGRVPSSPDATPDAAQLAATHGVSPERVAAMSQAFQCLSLAAPLADGDERTLGDLLPADPADNPEGALLENDLGERLAVAVGELPEREAQILRLRFGLNGHRAYTLEEIGARFGVSRERVRQLEARALRRMRAICDEQGLSELLN